MYNDLEDYKKHKREMHELMLQKQSVDYEVKVEMSKARITAFIEEATRRGLNTHVSVGGLDSIVLAYLIRSMGYDIPLVSASTLEDASVQAVHKELGCIVV